MSQAALFVKQKTLPGGRDEVRLYGKNIWTRLQHPLESRRGTVNDNTLGKFSDAAPILTHPRAFDTILYGGLVVGVLDALDAVIFFGLQGMSPINVYQYVASGLLGSASFNGGLATALLGLLFHFLISFAVAAVYYAASLILPMLVRRAVVCGLFYGVAVFLVMNLVVLPLSSTPKTPFSITGFLNGVIGHAILVGLPVALIARWSAQKRNLGV